MDAILKRFESPDETRVFEKGKFEIVEIGGMTIGRATYQPGWKMVGARRQSNGRLSVAASSMSGWWFPAARRRRWTMAG